MDFETFRSDGIFKLDTREKKIEQIQSFSNIAFSFHQI